MITLRTVTYIDPGANSRKFYRSYEAPGWTVCQYGRIGTHGAFTPVRKYASAGAVKMAAESVIQKKMSEGYSNLQVTQFDEVARGFGPNFVPSNREDLRRLSEATIGTPLGGATLPPTAPPAPPPPPPIEHSLDRLASFNDRALAAITLAVTDPIAAATEFAVLNAQWAGLQDDVSRAQSYLTTLDQLLGVPA